MPTGYTCGVQNGEITELKDYILQCARNFGACIHMRGEDFNSKPIDFLNPGLGLDGGGFSPKLIFIANTSFYSFKIFLLFELNYV